MKPRNTTKKRSGTDRVDERILAESLREFELKGYYRANLDHVARRLELGKGTIYRHFKDKKNLFASVVIYVMRKAGTVIEEVSREPGFEPALERYLSTLVRIQSESSNLKEMTPEESMMILMRERPSAARMSSLMAEMFKLKAVLVDTLKAILERGVQEGRVPCNVDLASSAELIASLVHSFCRTRMMNQGGMHRPAPGVSSSDLSNLRAFIHRAIGFVPEKKE